jgi:phosphoribosylanthranilate isomerase
MKIKVCGMCDAENVRQVGKLSVDLMGFVFYPPSPRFAGNDRLLPEALRDLPPTVRRAGVFVSELPDVVADRVEACSLDVIQLHGRETPEYCRRMKERFPSKSIIKAFPIAQPDDFTQTRRYEAACDYLLFDTKTKQYGGSGKQFDWKVIDAYRGRTPFFLSGGISVDDAERIKAIRHPSFYGVDLNSRFELSPGIKNTDLLRIFIETLRYEPD